MCLTGVFGRARRPVLASCFFITFTALIQLQVFAVSSVTLAWDPSTSTNVAGYHIYYGVASRSYTNSISVDLATTATVSGLLEGVTYYFAATALDTAGLESDFSNETSYSVPNQPPTLDLLSDLIIDEDSPQQTINLTGITSGAVSESQTLTVTATSSNPSLIPNPTVTYSSPDTAGSLIFLPAAYGFGAASITVTANDGYATVSRSFIVTVNFVNHSPTLAPLPDLTMNENAGLQTVNLSGI